MSLQNVSLRHLTQESIVSHLRLREAHQSGGGGAVEGRLGQVVVGLQVERIPVSVARQLGAQLEGQATLLHVERVQQQVVGTLDAQVQKQLKDEMHLVTVLLEG